MARCVKQFASKTVARAYPLCTQLVGGSDLTPS